MLDLLMTHRGMRAALAVWFVLTLALLGALAVVTTSHAEEAAPAPATWQALKAHCDDEGRVDLIMIEVSGPGVFLLPLAHDDICEQSNPRDGSKT